MLLLPQAGGFLINRGVPPRVLVTISLILIAAGNAWLTTLHPGITATGLLAPLATIGTGMGLMIGTTDAQAVNQVAQERIGMATGLLNTVRAGGGALATTLFGTALATVLHARIDEPAHAARIAAGKLAEPGHALEATLLTEAWQTALWCTTAICAAATLAVWTLLGSSRRHRPAPAPAPAAQPQASARKPAP